MQVKSRINTFTPTDLGPLGRAVPQVLRAAHRIPPFVTDSMITAIAVASMFWGVAASQSADRTHWSPWVWGMAVLVSLPLQWRRRAPFGVWLVVGISVIVYSFVNPSASSWNHCNEFVLLVAMTTVAYLGTKQQFFVALPLSIAGTFVVVLGPDRQTIGGSSAFIKSLFSLLAILLAFCAGRLGAKQREHAAMMVERANQIEQTAAAQAAEAAAEERTRIARDMHDIVAHAVSLMVVQAEAGASVLHNSPDRAERAFDSIADTGREALAQLRRVLGVLRDGDALALLAPQPTVSALPVLIASVRDTGLEVVLHAEGDSRQLHADAEIAVYRTVQEALTNTVKHAQASRAEVRLTWGWDTLTVTVADNGGGMGCEQAKRTVGVTVGIGARGADGTVGAQRAAGPAGSTSAAVPIPGRGLIGITERIGACGGTVTVGPGLDGRGFSISAVVPMQSAPASLAAPHEPEGHDGPAG